jgi:hypothetical protein
MPELAILSSYPQALAVLKGLPLTGCDRKVDKLSSAKDIH